MSDSLGLMELAMVLAFVVGWGVVELVGLRMDRRRREEAARAAASASTAPGATRHPERQQPADPGRSEAVER
jgi:hypothetical protein